MFECKIMLNKKQSTGSTTITGTNGNSNKVIIRNNTGSGIMVNRNSQVYKNYLARQQLKNKSFTGASQRLSGTVGRGTMVNINSQEYKNYLARRANNNKSQNQSNNTSKNINKSQNQSKNIKNATLLKNFSREYLHSCFLNTYTTLAYLTGQSTISDAVLFRYIISFETLLSKINGNLTTNREKIFEDLWNKTRGYENSKKFSTITDIEQHLRYYKTIMKNGFKSMDNSKLAALSRNLK